MEKHRGAALDLTASEAMTQNPQTIAAHTLASEALNLMEKRRITSVVVTDDNGIVLGVVHLHDLWTLQLI
jgi:arabinose-5-phosphate isomerase